MKTTLLIIFLFIGLGNLNAQDASNDATWEETISFIEKFLPNFDHVCMDLSDGSRTNYKYSLENNILIAQWDNSYGEDDEYTYRRIASILELSSVSLSDDLITLNFSGNVVKLFYEERGDMIYWKSENRLVINLLDVQNYEDESQNKFFSAPNSINTQRLYKAFKHLAYLAKEKRKQSKF
ncbi:hypothetical protein JCM19314_873 [Nonlabens ulvanivorans]|uniref:Uncharacterized protein n=1 Tax=Nonlabens ulvanivorans TaxID=906888 RepID=A0A090QI21_NONUL|nr:hypothetical protein [Nonlabens ulvanivorans]GAL01429.1 hypothetical protein JCM19314_873 [Nonlabens ulvanivorans]